MTSFGWKTTKKRKAIIDSNILLSTEEEEEEKAEEPSSSSSKSKRPLLEDHFTLAKRLKNEGVILAESEKFWSAVHRWNSALEHYEKYNEDIDIKKEQSYVHEMKAQAFIQLHEWNEAVDSSKLAISLNKTWYPAKQTLGRALIGSGNVKDAFIAFAKALHLRPDDQELLNEDFLWAKTLRFDH